MTNTAEEILNDLLKHGVRFDMNPTMQIGTGGEVYSQWARYAARMDTAWREEVREALDALAARSAPVPAEAATVEAIADVEDFLAHPDPALWPEAQIITLVAAARRSAPVGTTAEAAVERAARAMAILNDHDGCFERLDGWANATPEQRECGDVEEPMSTDQEDADWWRARARAALEAVSVPHPAPEPPRADHPYTDPRDGRTQCPTCGKWVHLVIHSCKGIRVAPAVPVPALLTDEHMSMNLDREVIQSTDLDPKEPS